MDSGWGGIEEVWRGSAPASNVAWMGAGVKPVMVVR